MIEHNWRPFTLNYYLQLLLFVNYRLFHTDINEMTLPYSLHKLEMKYCLDSKTNTIKSSYQSIDCTSIKRRSFFYLFCLRKPQIRRRTVPQGPILVPRLRLCSMFTCVLLEHGAIYDQSFVLPYQTVGSKENKKEFLK